MSQGQGKVVGSSADCGDVIFNLMSWYDHALADNRCRLPGCDFDVNLILADGGVAA